MRWTQEEDQVLERACRSQLKVSRDGQIKDWNAIASALPDRNNKDCRKRWYNVVMGCTKKGPWSPEEDRRLVDAVQEVGTSWQFVAQKIGDRSADQCAKRWQQNLDPYLEHREWTDAENRTLLRAVEDQGRRWLQIRKDFFPRRATNNIKNQYTILTKERRSSSRSVAAGPSKIIAPTAPGQPLRTRSSTTMSSALHSHPSTPYEGHGHLRPSPASDINDFLSSLETASSTGSYTSFGSSEAVSHLVDSSPHFSTRHSFTSDDLVSAASPSLMHIDPRLLNGGGSFDGKIWAQQQQQQQQQQSYPSPYMAGGYAQQPLFSPAMLAHDFDLDKAIEPSFANFATPMPSVEYDDFRMEVQQPTPVAPQYPMYNFNQAWQ